MILAWASPFNIHIESNLHLFSSILVTSNMMYERSYWLIYKALADTTIIIFKSLCFDYEPKLC